MIFSVWWIIIIFVTETFGNRKPISNDIALMFSITAYHVFLHCRELTFAGLMSYLVSLPFLLQALVLELGLLRLQLQV